MSTLYFADVAIRPSFFFTSSLLIAYHLIVPIGAAIAFKTGKALRVWSLLCAPLVVLYAYLTATEPTSSAAPFAGLFYFALAMVAYQLTSVPPTPISLLPGPAPEDQETQGAVEVQEERSLKDLWFGDIGAYPWGVVGLIFAVIFVLLWVGSAFAQAWG